MYTRPLPKQVYRVNRDRAKCGICLKPAGYACDGYATCYNHLARVVRSKLEGVTLPRDVPPTVVRED